MNFLFRLFKTDEIYFDFDIGPVHIGWARGEFFAISLPLHGIEFGQVDQETRGIHFVTLTEAGDVARSRTLLSFWQHQRRTH